MTLRAVLAEQLDVTPHEWRVYDAPKDDSWLEALAEEYLSLRTATAVPLTNVSVDGIQVLRVDGLAQRLAQAGVPTRGSGPFDVMRSDFGEVVAYMLLEEEYESQFGYKSVRDRETVQQPGRGIDALAVETDDVLTLVLGEVKVSDDTPSPPRVVDELDDSLRNQHLGHLSDLTVTADKVWNAARTATDSQVRDLFFIAAMRLEEGDFDRLRLISFCLLVRPSDRYQTTDFGSFRDQPNEYDPSHVRFCVFRVDGRVDELVNKLAEFVSDLEGAS